MSQLPTCKYRCKVFDFVVAVSVLFLSLSIFSVPVKNAAPMSIMRSRRVGSHNRQSVPIRAAKAGLSHYSAAQHATR